MKRCPTLRPPRHTTPTLTTATQDDGPNWYATQRWKGPRGLRVQQLSRQPLCEDCLAMGKTTEATIVHHVGRHAGDAFAFFNAPLMSLCAECHQVRTNRGE